MRVAFDPHLIRSENSFAPVGVIDSLNTSDYTKRRTSKRDMYFLNQYLSHKRGKVKVKFTLEQATKAQRGSRGTAQLYSFLNLGVRWGWVVNATPRPLYPRESYKRE
jgi:hypothetical protein